MPDQSANDELLVRYLLGQVSDEDRTLVEERFLADEAYYRQLLGVEEELRFAYAKGSLPAAEREQFEKRFLIFSDEQKRVGMAREMLAELSGTTVAASMPLVPTRQKPGWWTRVLPTAGAGTLGVRLAMPSAALVLLAVLSWQVFESRRLRTELSRVEAARSAREQEMSRQAREDRSRLDQLNRELQEERNTRTLMEQELARPREPASSSGAVPAVISLYLAPGQLRGGGETKRLTIPPDSAQVRLLLDLGDKRGSSSYQAEILNSDGVRVWSRRGLAAGHRLVILTVPANLLPEDDYEIELKSVAAPRELERAGDYYFTVLKK